MLVRQLVGKFAGQIIDMPYHVAQSCLAAGTAALPDETPKMRGLHTLAGSANAAPTPAPTPEPSDEGGEVEAAYTIQEVSRGWYNVFDADGAAKSEKNMRKADAEALLASLNEG